MNSKRDKIIFCLLAILSLLVSVFLVIKSQHRIPQPKSDVWPALNASAVEKHYLEGKYSIHYSPQVLALRDTSVALDGFLMPLDARPKTQHFLLSMRSPTCPYCPPAAPNEMAEVSLREPVAWRDQMVSVRGILHLMPEKNSEGIFFQLQDAVLVSDDTHGMTLAPQNAEKKSSTAPYFTDLAGHEVALSAWRGKPLLLMFWRADCPPCLMELRNLAQFIKAQPHLPLALISLQDVNQTKSTLPALPKQATMLVAQGDARQLLADFGNDKMLALPYSVMLDAQGKLCQKHHGILTPEMVNQWAIQCATH